MFSREELTEARSSEYGIQAVCSTTHQAFVPRTIVFRGEVAWCDCPYCDKYRRTGREYDASQPQPHPVIVGGL